MAELSNVDPAEIARFQSAASRWWDADGEMRPLHDLNPVRLEYVQRAGPLSGLAVVDVGCGGGLLAEAMARKGARVVGLDLADELLTVARLHALETGVTLDYRLESAEQHAQANPGHYDVATCMEMLEHVPDPAAVVEALLEGDGIRVSDDPMAEALALLEDPEAAARLGANGRDVVRAHRGASRKNAALVREVLAAR